MTDPTEAAHNTSLPPLPPEPKSLPQRLAGRVAIVTGAGSGLGRATALRLAAEGARIVCLDVRGEEAIAEQLRGAGHDATAIRCDVRDEAAVSAAVAAAASWGGGISVVANFAGVAMFAHFTDVSLGEWERILGINLTGTFLVTREAMPHLLTSRGAVVNIASAAGLRARPYLAPYSASKGGVIMLTKALALEYAARGVRVNCVCPGGVDTAITDGIARPNDADPRLISLWAPMGRRGEAHEIAAAVAYLASDDASFVTGISLPVDGASTA